MKNLILFFLVIFPNIFIYFGLHYYKKQDYDKAIEYFNKAMDTDEKYFNLGCAYYKKQDYTKAKAYFVKAIEKQQDKKELSNYYYNLGNSNFKLGNVSEAKQNYIKSLILNPNNFDAKYNLAIVLFKETLESSKSIMELMEKERQEANKSNTKVQSNNIPESPKEESYNIPKIKSEIIVKSIISKAGKEKRDNNRNIQNTKW